MTTAQSALPALAPSSTELPLEPDPDPHSGEPVHATGNPGVGVPSGPSAPDSTSDAALVRDLVAGSHDALSVLYDRHSAAVFSAAMRISREAGMAADVVQETFLALWNRAESYDPSRGALIAWLLTIARNRTVDHLRSAGRHDRAISFSSFLQPDTDEGSTSEWLTTTGAPVAMGGPELGPEAALTSRETATSIRAAIAALEPYERQVIELAYDAGLSQPEIAAQLGWPLGTVKTRTRRALRRLRDTLEQAAARRVEPRPYRVQPSRCPVVPCS